MPGDLRRGEFDMQTKLAKRPFENGPSVPPILLLLDEHSESRDMYTTFFQQSGFCGHGRRSR
jgi:hypothetical protein